MAGACVWGGGHVWQEACGVGAYMACMVGGMCGRGACMAWGVHGRGPCMAGGVHGRGRHAWQGVCMAGGMHGRDVCGRRDGNFILLEPYMTINVC